MRSFTVLLVVAALTVSGAALAQYGYGYGEMPPDEAYEGFRVHAGWISPNDLDDDLTYGADYIWRNALLSVNLSRCATVIGTGDSSGSTAVDLWSVEASYLLRGQADPGLYYGAGLGWCKADWDSPILPTSISPSGAGGDDDSLIWNVVLGKEFAAPEQFGEPAWFLEARYSFGSKIGEGNVDGLRVVTGYRF